MRVFGRVVILGLFCAAFARPADAAPIVWSQEGRPTCDANSNCNLFSLGALAGNATFDFSLEFASDTDFALFEFSTAGATTFLAETSLTESFPLLGVFSNDVAKTIYSYNDPENGELQAFGFSRLEAVPLAADSSYYLAVLLHPNGFSGTPTSLLAGFACDGPLNDCTGIGANFALSLQAVSNQPDPIPEPGTLVLLATGLGAACARMRKKRASSVTPCR